MSSNVFRIHHTDFCSDFLCSAPECQQQPSSLPPCGHQQHLLTCLHFLHSVLVLDSACHGLNVIILFKQAQHYDFSTKYTHFGLL